MLQEATYVRKSWLRRTTPLTFSWRKQLSFQNACCSFVYNCLLFSAVKVHRSTRQLCVYQIQWNNAMLRPLRRSRSFKVNDFGTNQKLIYDLLLVINTNLPPVLYRFQVMSVALSCLCCCSNDSCGVELNYLFVYVSVVGKLQHVVRLTQVTKYYIFALYVLLVSLSLTPLLPRCLECRRGLAMRILSVRPSVCLTNACIVTKRKKRSVQIFFYHTKDHLA